MQTFNRTAASVYETIQNLKAAGIPFDFLEFYRTWAYLFLLESRQRPADYPVFIGLSYPAKWNRRWPDGVPLGEMYCQKILYRGWGN